MAKREQAKGGVDGGGGGGAAGRVERRGKQVATPWGPAELVEEVSVRQQAGERRFASHVQLLVSRDGSRLVRFAYSTGGTARRGPVTLRARELERLVAALAERPQLADLLGLGGGA